MPAAVNRQGELAALERGIRERTLRAVHVQDLEHIARRKVHDVIFAFVRLVNENVVAALPVKRIVTLAAPESVLAAAADEFVVSVLSAEVIVALAAAQGVVAVLAVKFVLARAADD